MSTSVLPQLLEVDSELNAQATALAAQLTELQEKRKGIQTVIAMFESGVTPDAASLASVSAASSTSTKKAPTATRGSKTKAKRKTAKATTAKATTRKKPAAKTTAKTAKVKATKVKATRGRPAKSKTVKAKVSAAKPAAAKSDKKEGAKRSGRTANWQKYVQDSYSKSPLPDVIVGVLQAQPNNVFKIADVMSMVFKEDMPKNHFLKARNRISNILSAGARDGVWYRGRGGTYSMSEKSIKAS